MNDKNTKTRVVVIGAGPGGYAAAFFAADRGMNVTLVDPETNPGGVCLYRGCIPSKALLHVAKVIRESREAGEWGVDFAAPKLNIERMRKWKNEVVGRLTGGLGQLTKQRKVRYLQGKAAFLDDKTLAVDTVNGKQEELSFDYAVIATGSYPIAIPKLWIDSPRMLNSTSGLDLDGVPKTLLVIGGGYIGLELGTVYATLGSKVTVVEMLPGLLPGADRDLAAMLVKRLKPLFESIRLNTTVTEIKEQRNGLKVKLQGKDSKEENKVFEKVLMSVGRKPNSGGLGLKNTRIKLDERGFIEVDAQRRTAEPKIFAIGDVVGEPMLAHKASHEGRVAVEAIEGHKAVFDPRAIPAVVFTDPEIAWAGLTETDARRQGVEYNVAKFPWAASGRALSIGRTDGVTKLLIDPKMERILGIGIAGPGAGDLIAEGVFAMEMGANATDLKLTIHPHPTLSETIMEAAEVFFGESTHVYRPRRKE